MTPLDALERLRTEILNQCRHNEDPLLLDRLDLCAQRDGVHVFFYGSAHGEAYRLLMERVSAEPIASALLSLLVDGPDEGANGTREWDLAALTRGADFPLLRQVQIARTGPADHNRTIADCDLERLAPKAPQLARLIMPSAPHPEFFAAPWLNLSYLAVDAGYETQSFIHHLANADLPKLRAFEWGEYAETYIDNWREETTPFEHMVQLFQSPFFERVRRFVLRNPAYSQDQLRGLKKLRPQFQFLTVRSSSEYV